MHFVGISILSVDDGGADPGLLVNMCSLLVAEYDALLPQDTELAQQTNVPDVFGATTEDTQGLRIVSLYEVSTESTAVLMVTPVHVHCWCCQSAAGNYSMLCMSLCSILIIGAIAIRFPGKGHDYCRPHWQPLCCTSAVAEMLYILWLTVAG